jgi:antitoxin VapB
MSLSVKNPRAYALAAKLAQLTGESLTDAVIRALEIRLQQEEQRRGKKTAAERILAFADRFAKGLPPDCKSSDHASLLYGDDGLPK